MKWKLLFAAGLLIIGAAFAARGQNTEKDEVGHIQALETAWNHALEAKDANALNMLLANTMISVDIDGSVTNKSAHAHATLPAKKCNAAPTGDTPGEQFLSSNRTAASCPELVSNSPLGLRR